MGEEEGEEVKYLFIGGDADGKRLKTNGSEFWRVIRLFPPEVLTVDDRAGAWVNPIKTHDYLLRKYGGVPVYVLEGMSDLDAERHLVETREDPERVRAMEALLAFFCRHIMPEQHRAWADEIKRAHDWRQDAPELWDIVCSKPTSS